MDKKDKIICFLISICLLLAAGLGLTLLKDCSQEGTEVSIEKTVEVEYDTIPYYHPVPKDSVVLRYATARLPISHEPGDTIMIIHEKDSVAVEIPITQKEYGDSTYHAWVSGYMANLDSIAVYQKTEYIRETISRTSTKRWNFTIGPTVGAGWNGQKISPYIGLGITWGYSF